MEHPLFNSVLTLFVLTSFVVGEQAEGAKLVPVAQIRNKGFGGSYGSNLAYSPDGKIIAVGEYRIGLWDAVTGDKLHQMEGHSKVLFGGVSGLVFTSDSKVLISSGEDGAVRFWDTKTGTLIREIVVPWVWVDDKQGFCLGRVPLRSVAISPDDQLLAACAHDLTIRLWDMETGRYLACLGKSKAQQIDPKKAGIELEPGEECWKMSISYKEMHPTPRFSPDGRILAAAHDDFTNLWNIAKRELWKRLPDGGYMAYHPDGKSIVTSKSARVTVWDAESGEKLHQCPDSLEIFSALQFSPDGKLLATGSDKAQGIRLWDFQTGKLKQTLPYGGDVLDEIRFSPDGTQVAATVRRKQVHVFDVTSGRRLFDAAHSDRVDELAFTSDGQYLVSAGSDSSIRVWDSKTWKPVESLTLPNTYVSAMLPLDDSPYVLIGDSSGVSRIVHIPSLEIKRTFQHAKEEVSSEVAGYALYKNRLFVGVDDLSSAVETWDWKANKFLARSKQHPTYSLLMTSSRDHAIVATADYDGNVLVWRKSPINRIAELQIDGNHTAAIALTPDGEKLATIGWHRSHPLLQLWKTQSKEELFRAVPGGSGITEATWSPDGTILAISSMGKPGLYLLESGNLEGVHGTGEIHALAYSPDGRFLAAGDESGQIIVWQVKNDSPM